MQPGGFPPQQGGFPQQPGFGPPQQPGWGPPQQPGWGPPQQPPYGAPSPYGGMQQPPAKSKMGCIIGVVVAVLGIIALIGGFVFVIMNATAPARDAGHAFLGKLRKGDYQAAWESSGSSMKGDVSAAELRVVMDREFPEAAKSTDATFNSTSISNSNACLSGSLTTPSGSAPIYMRLEEEGGTWRVVALANEEVKGC